MSAHNGTSQESVFSRTLTAGFRRYVRRFVRRNFNAVRIANPDALKSVSNGPLICFINHPGWWDPMTAVMLTDCFFADRRFSAPMDAEALTRYPILERLGFFPVARESAAGAREFLRSSRQQLAQPNAIMWLTPAGKFCDVRQSVPFMSGLSHLTGSGFTGTLLPVAVEYTFWNERYPEVLVEFHSALNPADLPADQHDRNQYLQICLERTQASLAAKAIARDPELFTTLATGRSGIGGVYETFRRLVAAIRGRTFQSRHDNPTAIASRLYSEAAYAASSAKQEH